MKRRTSAGSGSGRCGASHLHLHIAAKELQRRMHQEPRCQPVAFAPILASFRLTTEREQNESEGESKAAGSKAHARNGTEVAVFPWQHRASHEGLQGRGAVIWCVHRDASCHLRCRLSGTYQTCGKIVTPWCSAKTSYQPTSILLSSFIETGNYLPQQYHQTVDMARFYCNIVSDWLRSLAEFYMNG
ncbi:MAG: hypothetical protein ACXWOL_17540 [Ktedonobacteraceae bacterium]